MSVSTVKARLALMFADITGMSATWANAPESLSSLPATVVYTSDENLIEIDTEIATFSRLYRPRVYIISRTQGTQTLAEEAANAYFPLVRSYFLTHQLMSTNALGGLDGVLKMDYQGDGGMIVAPFAGQDYYAIEWRILVTEAVPYTYTRNK